MGNLKYTVILNTLFNCHSILNKPAAATASISKSLSYRVFNITTVLKTYIAIIIIDSLKHYIEILVVQSAINCKLSMDRCNSANMIFPFMPCSKITGNIRQKVEPLTSISISKSYEFTRDWYRFYCFIIVSAPDHCFVGWLLPSLTHKR